MAFGSDAPFKWRNFWACLAIATGQIAWGYPSEIIGPTLGIPAFLKYMGLEDPRTAGDLIGATNGVYQAGAFFGIIANLFVMERWGRKAGVVAASVVSIFGSTLVAAAQNIAMFIVFRFFAGAGAYALCVVLPIYTAEIAAPELRGLFVGLNGVMCGFGYSIAAYMGLAFSYSSNETVQWRAPLALAVPWPILMLVLVYYLPESPRYLLLKNRNEEAWKVVSSLHSTKNDADQVFAREEFYQMQKQTELDRTIGSSWLKLFTKPSNQKRLMVGMGFAFVGQSTGDLVINNYGPTFYSALGFNPKDQLILQAAWVSVSIFGNLVGALLLDRVGRRPIMLFAVGACVICLSIEAAMVAEYATFHDGRTSGGSNKAGLSAGVFALFLFEAVYTSGIDVAGFVFFAEIWPNHDRVRGVALSWLVFVLTDLVYLQVTATAFAHIGWRYFLVFIVVSAVGWVWMWFCIPETRGRPLEEMAELFGDKDEVMVYLRDLHIDEETHEVVEDGPRKVAQVEGEAKNIEHVHV
ncbi:hypothetical protein AYO20_07703 [Fonsecaea nubica]|uniref:Major facilitator superfamily (MFS) profile domain-containing protein n=1 Tax=Fonsecaea nubica TaxID=856822 RepID=A0A178CUR0_9EURO|nr:hypothetical protein AYO20_07703 [Fonsecaea nubica]OAL32912.1 hypothetical protein AYO20_07703 [Fonsecaea nubica]